MVGKRRRGKEEIEERVEREERRKVEIKEEKNRCRVKGKGKLERRGKEEMAERRRKRGKKNET